MTDGEKPNICHLKLYTGVYGSDDECPPVIIWITVDGDVFLGCSCRTPRPLRFVDGALQCPECECIISEWRARKEILIILKQVAALYGLFCIPSDVAVVETEETDQTD